MEAPATPASTASRGRTIAFRIVAGLLGVATLALSLPFAIFTFTDAEQEIHAFHNLGAGMATGVVFGVGLVLAAWKPREMIAAFQVTFVASVMVAIGGVLAGDLITGAYFVGLIVAAILVLLHPFRHELVRLGRVRASMLVLWIAWSIPAIGYALTQTELQRSNPSTDPHADLHHYSNSAAAVLSVLAAALVAALGTRGTRVAGWITGVTGALLGLASLAYADRTSAFDTAWAWFALVWSGAFVLLSELEARRDLTG